MAKEVIFDPDYTHGVLREFYIRRLVAGGTKRESISMPPHKIDQHCLQYGALMRAFLGVLADRGDIDPAKLKPTAADKARAPIPVETTLIKPAKPPVAKPQKAPELKKAAPEALPAPAAPVTSGPRVRERTRSRS